MKDTGWTFQGYRVLESENVPTPVGIRYTDSHQERILNTHIDTLKEWFDNAEDGDIYEGDTFIHHLPEVGRFVVGVATVPNAAHPYRRILHRAPKPKPAWHDAVAVIATFRDERGMVTGVWVPEGPPGYWEGPEGDVVAASVLENVTPLIEAKVTDEMIVRAANAWTGNGCQTARDLSRDLREDITHALTAALGLETT